MAKVRIPKFKLGDRIEIEWIDAVANPGWFERQDFKWPEMRCKTIGYYLDRNDIAIAVVDSKFDDYEKEDGGLGGYKTVPLGMITAVRRLYEEDDE